MTRETAERIAEAVARGDLPTARELFQHHGYTVTSHSAFLVVSNPRGTRAVITPHMTRHTLRMIFRRLDPTIELPANPSGCHECPERAFPG